MSERYDSTKVKKNKFGQQALDNVKDLSKIKLERKLLRG